MDYQARYYAPGLGRFVSADTMVPDYANPQGLNRYTYVYNNSVKYTDPSGHYIVGYAGSSDGVRMNQAPYGTSGLCPKTENWITEGEAAINEYHEELRKELSAEPNYPINAAGSKECSSSLPDCFGATVYLKDFSGHGKDNPIPIDEFTEFADKVAADLYLHDLTWPGVSAGRQVYDTPFYNGGGSERRTNNSEGRWPSNQQVCIETLGCSGRSEINYLAQGMWGAAKGEPLPVSETIVRTWKAWEYQEVPSEGTLKWLRWGYEYYQRYQEEHKQ